MPTIMYPGPAGSPENHKKGLCSDGTKPLMLHAPEWPQPQGIFEEGITFNPITCTFLKTLREVTSEGDGGDQAIEYDAFLKMIQARTSLMMEKRWLFKLFELDLSHTPKRALH